MRKLKTIKRVLALIIASSMLISAVSCKEKADGKNGSSSVQLSEARKILNYYDSEDLGIPEGVDYIQNIQSVNDKLYLYGMSVADINMAEFYSLDSKTKTVEQFKLEKSTFPSAIDYRNGKFYTTAFDENSGTVVYVHDKDKKCEQTLKISDTMDTMVYGLSSDNDGNIYVLTLTSKGMSFTSNIVVYDSNGKEKNKINLNEKCGSATGAISLYQLLLNDGKGGLYTARVDLNMMTGKITNTVIYKLNSSLEKESEISDLTEIGQLTTLFINKSGNLMVAGTDDTYSMCYVNEINSTGETVNRFEIEGTYLAFEGTKENELIYYNENGLFSYNTTDGKSTEIYSFLSDDAPQSFKSGSGIGNVGVVIGDDGEIILYSVPTDANMYNILVADSTGKTETTIPVTLSSNGNTTGFFVSNDEKIYYLEQAYEYELSNDEDVDNAKCTLKLHVADNQGKELNVFDIPDFEGTSETYASNFVVDSNGNACFIVEDEQFENRYCLYVIDPDGKVLTTNTDSTIETIEDLIASNNGKIYAKYSDEDDKAVFSEVNMTDGKLGAAVTLNGVNINSSTKIYRGNGKYNIFINDGTALYGYDFEAGKSEEIVNWLDSDFSQNFSTLAVVNENSIACVGYNEKSMDAEDTLLMLNKADAAKLEKINNKKVITAAGHGIGSDVSAQITLFNKSNDDSRIQVYDYAKYDTADDENNGIKQLNTDIVSGNIPDIILANSSLNIDTYVKKGMLTDLNTFIDKDNEIKKEDFLENIFEIGSKDGKLYQIIPSFRLTSLIGKQSVVGEEEGWDINEFMEFAEENKDKDMFYMTTRDALLEIFMGAGMSEFVDFSASKCDFQNENFTKILEFVKENAEDKVEENKSEEEQQEYEKRFWNDKCMLDFVSINGFTDFNVFQSAYVKEAVTFKGMPSKEKAGAFVDYNESFAISEKSKNKDMAWQFVREYLLDDYQKKIIDGTMDSSFPIKLSTLDDMVAKSQNSEENMMQSYFVGGEQIQIGVIDDENAEKVMNTIKNAKTDAYYDETILDIIREEAKGFFAGSATSDEAAANIQNRVKTYVDEQK